MIQTIEQAEELAMEVHESNYGIIGIWPIGIAYSFYNYAKDYLHKCKSELRIVFEETK